MKQDRFYEELFRPVRERIGPIDATDIIPFVGFDRGGVVRLSTVGRERGEFVTFVTCELATCPGQRPARFGNYEFMMSCDDTPWTRKVLTAVGRMSFQNAFEHGHALDIGETFGPDFPIQGLVVEEFARTSADGRPCGIHRIHGLTRPELDFVIRFGVNRLLEASRQAGVYPHTSIHRSWSVTGGHGKPDLPTVGMDRVRLLTAISTS